MTLLTRRGIDDLGDRLARQNRRGRWRPGRAYDERKIDAVRQVWALANESAEAKQSLNTRMTFAVALRYGKPVLDQAGITTREEFARIRHAISCRESRARIKALEATRSGASATRTCASATRTVASATRTAASSTRTSAPTTRSGDTMRVGRFAEFAGA